MKKWFFLLSGVVLMWSCGSSDKGELVGVQNRPIFEDIDLKGMVFINQGNFSMGAGTQNVTYGTPPQPRTMQVSSYFMDETEITNNEYRQFVNWVIDSIARRMLGEAGIDGYLIEEDEYGEPIEPAILNKKEKIRWNEQETREALEDLYLPEKDRFYRRRTVDPAKLNYEFYRIDYAEAAKKESSTAVKDEYKGTMFAPRPKGLNNRNSFIKREVVNIYPDTLCWVHDYTYSMNEDFTRQYFTSPAYDNYPVVGVSWVQANAFCVWRSNYLNQYLESIDYTQMNDFRLPTEAEWEFAARGGIAGESYGNVSEWCLDAYNNATYVVANALSPYYNYNAKDNDSPAMKQKVIRGGSWKDQKYFIQVQTRSYEYQDTAKSYIGFRCVQPYLGRVKGDNLKSASNVAK